MVDIVDKATRSRMMSGIRGRDTKPELLLRKRLHKLGFRYRLHARDLPGRPDILLPRFEAAVFVHGCFWHRHNDCKLAAVPSSNHEFWSEKFAATVARDGKAVDDLLALGWRVAVVWECAIRSAKIETIATTVGGWLNSGRRYIEVPSETTKDQFRDRRSRSARPNFSKFK